MKLHRKALLCAISGPLCVPILLGWAIRSMGNLITWAGDQIIELVKAVGQRIYDSRAFTSLRLEIEAEDRVEAEAARCEFRRRLRQTADDETVNRVTERVTGDEGEVSPCPR